MATYSTDLFKPITFEQQQRARLRAERKTKRELQMIRDRLDRYPRTIRTDQDADYADDMEGQDATGGGGGEPGPPGPPNELEVGTVTTGAPGSNATVTITGESPEQIINFGIPRGNTGAPGTPGTPGAPGGAGPAGPANVLSIGTVGTVAPGGAATASITGTTPAQTLNLGIPRGDKGDRGDAGPVGPAAANGRDITGWATTADFTISAFPLAAQHPYQVDKNVTWDFNGVCNAALTTSANGQLTPAIVIATITDATARPRVHSTFTWSNGSTVWGTGIVNATDGTVTLQTCNRLSLSAGAGQAIRGTATWTTTTSPVPQNPLASIPAPLAFNPAFTLNAGVPYTLTSSSALWSGYTVHWQCRFTRTATYSSSSTTGDISNQEFLTLVAALPTPAMNSGSIVGTTGSLAAGGNILYTDRQIYLVWMVPNSAMAQLPAPWSADIYGTYLTNTPQPGWPVAP